jgi:hypothetical protein
MITQMVVNFSEPVTFAGGDVTAAMTLTRTSINSLSTGGGTTGAVGLVHSILGGPVSSVTVTFVTSSNQTEFGSLRDGFYDFTIDADLISGPGGLLDGENNPAFPSGNGTAGGDYVLTGNTLNKFFRLFGDKNGNGQVDLSDFAALRSVINLTYDFAFDFDNSGMPTPPGLGDFAEFRRRFNATP